MVLTSASILVHTAGGSTGLGLASTVQGEGLVDTLEGLVGMDSLPGAPEHI